MSSSTRRFLTHGVQKSQNFRNMDPRRSNPDRLRGLEKHVNINKMEYNHKKLE